MLQVCLWARPVIYPTQENNRGQHNTGHLSTHTLNINLDAAPAAAFILTVGTRRAFCASRLAIKTLSSILEPPCTVATAAVLIGFATRIYSLAGLALLFSIHVTPQLLTRA